MSELFDLGCEHFLEYYPWSPDRELNPQYDGIPDIERAVAVIHHKTPEGKDCTSAVHFDKLVDEVGIEPNCGCTAATPGASPPGFRRN